MKSISTLALLFVIFQVSGQIQSWQWVKAGGSSNDNTGALIPQCRISGCDAKGNVYAMSYINGTNVVFDTFQSTGTIGPNGINQLIFSYDCSGNMRWARQIGDMIGSLNTTYQGIATDIQGNTYLYAIYLKGFKIGDTTIDASLPNDAYDYLIKLDSLGGIVWVKNYGLDANYTNAGIGIRIGSSGNLWMKCHMDSNLAFAPALHTTKAGYYQVEADPSTGNVLGGYYTSNVTSSDGDFFDNRFDIDGNENYYEVGNLQVAQTGIGPGDTLRLNGHTFAPDSSLGYGEPYVYSLDKQGNFRYFITTTGYQAGQAYTCRYDLQNDRFVATLDVWSGNIYNGDTVRFNSAQMTPGTGYDASKGIYCIGPNGNSLWLKYYTYAVGDIAFAFQNTPTANYISSTQATGYEIYAGEDSFMVGDTANLWQPPYYRIIQKIDENGNITATYKASLGSINPDNGDAATSGATDWRGNLYMGGSITNYMALPNGGDSVVNTDASSGNFFIAKIGISDCSCPTPGVQFTQAAHGDTVTFYGSSINNSDSIHWELGDGTVSTTDTFTHVYADTGTYTVTAIAYSGCGIDSITRQVRLTPTGINTIQSLQTRAYPNPAQGSIYVDVSAAAKIGMVAANGTSMWDAPKEVSQPGTYVFDMSKYSAGLYYFLVEYSNGETDVMQVVKK